jgi:hypothetical protein
MMPRLPAPAGGMSSARRAEVKAKAGLVSLFGCHSRSDRVSMMTVDSYATDIASIFFSPKDD